MKIMILANSGGGLYRFRRELLEELVKTHKVDICLPKDEFTEDLKNLGCNFIECNLLERHGMNPLKEVSLIRYYKQLLKSNRPDIVFTYTIKPNVYGGMMCGKFHIPYVANVTGLGTAVENPGLMQLVTVNLYKMGLKRAQKVFFQNTENRDFMCGKNAITGAYDLLPGSGVNLNQFAVSEYPEKEMVDFVFVGRMMKEKGIDNYLEAAEAITKKYPNTRFHICGEPEQNYESRIELLKGNDRIIFHGMVKNMKDMYSKICCTIHPTYYPEGLSNVLLESAASGRPIITTDRAGCREVIDDGINGYVCKQNDTKDLIAQIEKFLAHSKEERKEMGLAGRRKVEKEFNRQIVIQKYLQEVEFVKEA